MRCACSVSVYVYVCMNVETLYGLHDSQDLECAQMERKLVETYDEVCM